MILLDSGLRRNDQKGHFLTFYECIKVEKEEFRFLTPHSTLYTSSLAAFSFELSPLRLTPNA